MIKYSVLTRTIVANHYVKGKQSRNIILNNIH